MGRDDLFESCRFRGIALGATLFIGSLGVVHSGLSGVYALVGAFLLAVKLLLLGRGGGHVQIGAQALLLAATLGVHAIRVGISNVSHGLLIL